jgi:hypothetical protein
VDAWNGITLGGSDGRTFRCRHDAVRMSTVLSAQLGSGLTTEMLNGKYARLKFDRKTIPDRRKIF